MEVSLEAIAGLGLEYVDIGSVSGECEHFDPTALSQTHVRDIGDLMDSLGLRLAAVNVFFGAFNDVCVEVAKRQTNWIKASMDIARSLNAPVVTTSLGKDFEWQAREDALSHALPHVKECAEYGKETNVVLGLEMPHKYSLARNLHETVELVRLLSKMEGIGITLDTSQVAYGGDSAAKAMKLLGERVVHVHLRDAKGKYTRVAPGKGEVNFRDFFASAMERRYEGVFTLEFEVDEYSSTNLEVTKGGIAAALDYLRTLV